MYEYTSSNLKAEDASSKLDKLNVCVDVLNWSSGLQWVSMQTEGGSKSRLYLCSKDLYSLQNHTSVTADTDLPARTGRIKLKKGQTIYFAVWGGEMSIEGKEAVYAKRDFTCRLRVSAAKVKLSKTGLTMNVGDSASLKVTGNSDSVKWSSTNSNIVQIKACGTSVKLKAKKAGSVKVKAVVDGKTLVCKVKVKAKASSGNTGGSSSGGGSGGSKTGTGSSGGGGSTGSDSNSADSGSTTGGSKRDSKVKHEQDKNTHYKGKSTLTNERLQ